MPASRFRRGSRMLCERMRTALRPACIAATHHDLRARVAEGRFRDDLVLPPRARSISPSRRFASGRWISRSSCITSSSASPPPGHVPPGVAPGAWRALEAYDFPGNVRELARAIEHAMVLAHGSEIDREHLPAEIARGPFDASDAEIVAARRRAQALRARVRPTRGRAVRRRPRARGRGARRLAPTSSRESSAAARASRRSPSSEPSAGASGPPGPAKVRARGSAAIARRCANAALRRATRQRRWLRAQSHGEDPRARRRTESRPRGGSAQGDRPSRASTCARAV